MIWPVVAAFQLWVEITDFIFLIVASWFYIFLSFYRLFFPPEMKSLEGEIVLLPEPVTELGKNYLYNFQDAEPQFCASTKMRKGNNRTVVEIRNDGGEAVGFVCDVTRPEEVLEVTKRIQKIIGDVTMVVTAYDIVPYKPFLEYTPNEIEMIFDSNVLSHIWTIKAWLPTFLKRGRGHIVSISSVCGTIGVPNLVPYSSSKHAVADCFYILTGFLESLTEELRYGNLNPNIKLTRIHSMPELVNFGSNQQESFPFTHSLMSIEDYGNSVVESVRREEEVVFIPNHYYHIIKLTQ
ncbi:17-beta-hydroxysteroid dehydrogenase 13 [Armadillidium vulgare]|nr:17-beta-hydroxysteroid dehydrogenase 13 [Armadillidium vulgare]